MLVLLVRQGVDFCVSVTVGDTVQSVKVFGSYRRLFKF